MYTTKKTTTKTQNRCFADDFLFHNASFRFFSPILMNNCPSVGVGRTILPFPITVQPTFQKKTFHIPAWNKNQSPGNSASCYDLSGMVSSLTQVTQTQRLANRDRPNDLELMGDRHVPVRKIIQTANLPFGGDMRRSVYQLVKLEINSFTFNGENPYTPSEVNWESLSTFNWECCINPYYWVWWVYPLFNMEILGVDRPFIAHICYFPWEHIFCTQSHHQQCSWRGSTWWHPFGHEKLTTDPSTSRPSPSQNFIYPPGKKNISHQTGSWENHRLKMPCLWGIC